MKAKHFSPIVFSLVTALMILNGCGQPPRQGLNVDIPYNEDSLRKHIISIDEARAYTLNYRNTTDSFDKQYPVLKTGYDMGRAEAFNRDAIAVLLNQKDSLGNPAAGIRVYYGLNKGGEVRMVLVPYDSQGNDIIHQLTKNAAVSIPGIPAAKAYWDNGQAVENGQRCPVVCSGTGGL